jgi:hypothetical protein
MKECDITYEEVLRIPSGPFLIFFKKTTVFVAISTLIKKK